MLFNNTATNAAGLAVYGNASVELDTCTLQNNSVTGGGAGMMAGEFAQVL
jgi:hypothetical protein